MQLTTTSPSLARRSLSSGGGSARKLASVRSSEGEGDEHLASAEASGTAPKALRHSGCVSLLASLALPRQGLGVLISMTSNDLTRDFDCCLWR